MIRTTFGTSITICQVRLALVNTSSSYTISTCCTYPEISAIPNKLTATMSIRSLDSTVCTGTHMCRSSIMDTPHVIDKSTLVRVYLTVKPERNMSVITRIIPGCTQLRSQG